MIARRRSLAVALSGALSLAACDSERSPMRKESPPGGRVIQAVETSGIQAGPAYPVVQVENPYDRNPRAIAEGERLYGWMNCGGCHGALGGGGIGPPFADGGWIYGGAPGDLFQSIVQGRPNGMPAFGSRLPIEEIWKLAAYVQVLGGGGGAGAPDGPTGQQGGGSEGAVQESGSGTGAGAHHSDLNR